MAIKFNMQVIQELFISIHRNICYKVFTGLKVIFLPDEFIFIHEDSLLVFKKYVVNCTTEYLLFNAFYLGIN